MITYTSAFPTSFDFFDLYETTGWHQGSRFTSDQLSNAIQESWYALSAYHKDHLVGFGRVISDGILHALIVELIVHPDYQGQGIGSYILQELVARCKSANIAQVQLFAAQGKVNFHEKREFFCRPTDAPGMELQNEKPTQI